MIDDRLRGLDHQVDAHAPVLDSQLFFQDVEQIGQRRHLFGDRDFGQGDDEMVGYTPARFLSQRSQCQVERAHRSLIAFVAERLDADADEGRQYALAHPDRQLFAHRDGVEILFLVRAIAIAILEIDPHVLDRLDRQLVLHPTINRVGDPGWLVRPLHRFRVRAQRFAQSVDRFLCARQRFRPIHAQDFGEQHEIGRVLIQTAQAQAAQFHRRRSLEQMRAAIQCVYRLPVNGIAGIVGMEDVVGDGDTSGNRAEDGGEQSLIHRSFSFMRA